jgi:hypothetical protein
MVVEQLVEFIETLSKHGDCVENVAYSTTF